MDTYYLPKGLKNLITRTQVRDKPSLDRPYMISYRDRKEHLTRLELEDGDLDIQPSSQVRRVQTFQYDREPIIHLAKALQELKTIRKDILKLRRRITKKQHRSVVQRNTIWTRGWIRKKPLEVQKRKIPEQYSWSLIWGKTEHITRYELLKRLLMLHPTDGRVPRWRRQKVWFDEHPIVRDHLKPTQVWKSNPTYIKRVILEKGTLGSYQVPIQEFKAFPIIRWARVNEQWARRMAAVRKQLKPLLAKEIELESRVAALQPKRSEYNALIEEQDSQLIRPAKSLIDEDGLCLPGYYPNAGNFDFECYSGTLVKPPINTDVVWLMTDTEQQANDWKEWGDPEHLPSTPYSSAITVGWDGWGCSVLPVDYGSAPTRVSLTKPVCVNLDNVPRMIQNAKDKRILAHTSLRNLNLRRDEVEFNWFRSVGELKDAPQTVQSGRAFFNFVKDARGRRFVHVVTTHGRTHDIAWEALTTPQRNALADRLPPLRRQKALAAVGWRKANLRTVTKATKLSVLASVYLSWKFAIAPTIGDIQTTVNNGREYVFAIRRGLGQLVRAHSVHFWSERSLRRMFSESEMMLKGINWRKPGRAVVDTRYPFTGKYDQEETVYFCEPDNTDSVRSLFHGDIQPPFDIGDHTAARVFVSTKFGLWFPSANPRDFGSLSEREYFKRIVTHNLEVMHRFEEECSPVVTYAQHVSGTAFARFTARQLETALGLADTTFTKALRLQVTGLNVYQTFWDLLPLSFVLEWFSNLRECAQACNNVFNMVLTDLNPSKATWETLRTQVWLSQTCGKSGSLTMSVEPIERWISPFEVHHDFEPTWYLNYGRVYRVTVGLRIRIKYDWTVDPSVGILIRSGIHRVVRKRTDVALPLVPKPRVRISITPAQAGSLAAMLMSLV